jgi:L-cystine transport system substrate-binding protein
MRISHIRSGAVLFALIALASLQLAAQTAKKPKKIVVGTGSTYKNVCFLDEKGQLAGFEIDTLKKIDELLPQYEFEFKIFDFKTILVSLETDKIDLAAHQYESNPDRRAKYLFADEGIIRYDLRIAVKAGRKDIASFDDLAKLGATVQAGNAASNNTYVTNKWNDEHGKKLNIVLAPSDAIVTVQNLDAGKIDAFITVERIVQDYRQSYGAKIDVVGEPVSVSNAYYLYRKNDKDAEALKAAVDGAVKTLKKDGSLKAISIKWFGADFVPEIGK